MRLFVASCRNEFKLRVAASAVLRARDAVPSQSASVSVTVCSSEVTPIRSRLHAGTRPTPKHSGFMNQPGWEPRRTKPCDTACIFARTLTHVHYRVSMSMQPILM